MQLRLILREAMRGSLDETAGSEVAVEATQVERVGSRVAALPGVWSGRPLDRGTAYLAFSRSGSAKAAEVLRETNLVRVVAEKDSLDEARWALACDEQRRPLAETLASLVARPRPPGVLATEYVAARVEEVLVGDPAGYSRFLDIVEGPDLSAQSQVFLVGAVTARVLAHDTPASPAAPLVDRLAVACFRILGRLEPGPVSSPIVGTYLPNLLGLDGGATRRIAGEIFRRFPDDRSKARASLQRHAKEDGAAKLIVWIAP